MIVYLASPCSQLQANAARDMPVLLSFAHWAPWLDKGYWQSFRRVLIDSGALEEAIDCPGTHQAPRNAETDHRRLWKDGGEP